MARASGAFIHPWALIDSWIRYTEAGGSGLAWLAPPALSLAHGC